jgi:outer membrane lipoprotein LolB
VTVRGRCAALAAVATMLALAGCATAPPAGSDWLSGRLSVRVDAAATTPARQLSSDFELRGDGERGELRLNSPLGTALAVAYWAPGEARLVTPDGERRYADLETLAREALGEALPLRALPAWLRGQPWPGADSRATAGGFEQLGWQVGLQRFAEGWLEVTRATPPAVLLRARLERPV